MLEPLIPDDPDPPPAGPVDWSFLDRDDGAPGKPADWVLKDARLYRGEMGADLLERHRWTRNIPPPATPPRYDPAAPSFDPGGLDSDDCDLDDYDTDEFDSDQLA